MNYFAMLKHQKYQIEGYNYFFSESINRMCWPQRVSSNYSAYTKHKTNYGMRLILLRLAIWNPCIIIYGFFVANNMQPFIYSVTKMLLSWKCEKWMLLASCKRMKHIVFWLWVILYIKVHFFSKLNFSKRYMTLYLCHELIINRHLILHFSYWIWKPHV